MNALEVWLDDASLGTPCVVGLVQRNRGKTGESLRFEYAQTWLENCAGIQPFALDQELNLVAGAHYATAGADQLCGIFLDCSPDRWGKMLMERREAIEAREQSRKVLSLRSWDFLLGVHDESRMGALRLRDAASGQFVDSRKQSAPPFTELRTLEAAAHQLERGGAQVDKWIKQLIAPGASLGGARPKASFRDADGALWLAKFPALEDRRDVGLWEYLTSQLSRAAGIATPPTRALALSNRGHTFAVQRFDRALGSRRCYSSAMTRLARHESEGASYLDLVEAIETGGASSQIDKQCEELFRRALFNILIGNRDDHLRNHGFLRSSNGWALSPAFDVNPNPDKSEHVLSIDGADASPDSALLIRTAPFYRLKPPAVSAIVLQVRGAVRGWDQKAKALGLARNEIELMRSVIDPER